MTKIPNCLHGTAFNLIVLSDQRPIYSCMTKKNSISTATQVCLTVSLQKKSLLDSYNCCQSNFCQLNASTWMCGNREWMDRNTLIMTIDTTTFQKTNEQNWIQLHSRKHISHSKLLADNLVRHQQLMKKYFWKTYLVYLKFHALPDLHSVY